MKGRAKNKKNKDKRNDSLNISNSLSYSEDNQENEFSILNKDNTNITNKEINFKIKEKEEDKNDENSGDIFENALALMDENSKNRLNFTEEYEPDFSINYPNTIFNAIPIFTPSTRLNNALQIEDKSSCLFFYYIKKKSLYPTIYNQLIGISGCDSIFVNIDLNEKDFIWAGLTSIIFTNQKNFINVKILINEYITPLMKKHGKSKEETKIFIEQLCQNIIIQEYFSYDELFIKLNEFNILIKEHKLNKIGLVILDGLNTITTHNLDIRQKENEKGFYIDFYKFEKFEQNPNKNNKKFSSDKKNQQKKNYEEIRAHIYGNDFMYKKIMNNESINSYNEMFQQNILNLILKYQEKFNFNLIITIFDFAQDNYYNSCFGGRVGYKENKNSFIVNCPNLQKENCYFAFRLPKYIHSKKIVFVEPINLCLNYNDNIFGMITNPVKTKKFLFHVFKKDKDDYRPSRILEKIEYDYPF